MLIVHKTPPIDQRDCDSLTGTPLIVNRVNRCLCCPKIDLIDEWTDELDIHLVSVWDCKENSTCHSVVKWKTIRRSDQEEE